MIPDTGNKDCLASILMNVKLMLTIVIKKQNAQTHWEISHAIVRKALVEMALSVTRISVLTAFIIVIAMQLVRTPRQVSGALVKVVLLEMGPLALIVKLVTSHVGHSTPCQVTKI